MVSLDQLLSEGISGLLSRVNEATGGEGLAPELFNGGLDPQTTTDIIEQTQRIGTFESIFPTQTTQLISLGSASVDISRALSEQVTIREQQRRDDLIALGESNQFTADVQRQLNQLVEGLQGGADSDTLNNILKGLGETFGGNILGVPNALLFGGLIILGLVLIK